MSALVPIASTISNNTQQIAILSDSSELILKLWCRPAPLCLASILIKKRGTAICCVLLDIVEAMGTSADIKGCRHYQSLRDKTDITDSDFEGARSVSVLSSLVTLKGMHYNKKMLLALTVCDLYSGHTPVSLI